jgi:hypothetical protein
MGGAPTLTSHAGRAARAIGAALGRVAVATLALLALACAENPAAAQPPDRSYLFPIQITALEVSVNDAGQVTLDVEGVIPNGCSRFERVDQWRDANTVYVQVLARHSGAEVCTLIAQIYKETIAVDGQLEPGLYTADVNGTTRKVIISADAPGEHLETSPIQVGT